MIIQVKISSIYSLSVKCDAFHSILYLFASGDIFLTAIRKSLFICNNFHIYFHSIILYDLCTLSGTIELASLIHYWYSVLTPSVKNCKTVLISKNEKRNLNPGPQFNILLTFLSSGV